MAQRRVQALEELQSRAIELRLKNVRAKEIAKLLASGHSAWVIQGWLRDAGVPKILRARAVKLSAELPTKEVASAIGLSRRRIQEIVQESKGEARQYTTTEEYVDLFRADPYTFMTARFTRSPAFGRALLRRCGKEVDNNPRKALDLIQPSMALFDNIRESCRSEKKARQSLCFSVQCQGIEARAYEFTRQFRTALNKLKRAIAAADGCVGCEADELWRFACLHGTRKRWPQAHSALDGAFERYRSMSDAGHDLLGNGIASCMLVRGALLYNTQNPEAAAEEIRSALRILTGKESSTLFEALVVALAKFLLPSKDPREVVESQKLLDWCFNNLESARSRPVFRMFLHMLKGHLLAVNGQREDAIENLSLALDGAQECERENEIGLIIADLGLLDPDPRNIISHIEDVCDWDENGRLIFPPWCRNIDGELRRVYQLALESRRGIDPSVLVALRKTAGGDKRMPSFITPSSSPGLQAWDALR